MKILVAEDHPLYRQALYGLLRQLDETVELIDATNYQELTECAGEHAVSLDLILIGLRMPGVGGFEVLEQIKSQAPAVPIAVISASESRADARRSLQAGALGYSPKTLDSQIILGALRLILSGGVYVPELLLGKKSGLSERLASTKKTTARDASAKKVLTRRQQDVLRLMSKGESNKQIARQLGITEGTTKLHVSAIFKALKATNRTEATVKATELGIV